VIIRSSDQVPRVTALKRFPVPRNFGVSPESRIEKGKTWSAPSGAARAKSFEIYRYDPDSGDNPRLDTFEVDLDDCGPMVLDALFWIKNKVDSTLTFRRSCREGILRFVRDEYGWHELARLHEIHIRLGDARQRSILWRICASSRTWFPDLTHVFAQYAMIEPWLQSKTPDPDAERLQSREQRSRLDGYYECILCFCCTSGCPSHWWKWRPISRPRSTSSGLALAG